MIPDTAFALEIADVVTIAVLMVAIVAAASCADAGHAAVHDVDLALGAATLMTYAQAAANVKKNGKAPVLSPEGRRMGSAAPSACRSSMV
ncbi:hypothetical protein EJB05_05417, partial [Eragrostis curvula]